MARTSKSGHTLESIGEMVRNLSDRLHITTPKKTTRKKSAKGMSANGAATMKRSRNTKAAKKRTSSPKASRKVRSKAR
jgi:hypothetical protein